MSLLILPSRRVVQPQGPVDVHWGNPLARGLTQVVYGRNNLPSQAMEIVGAVGIEPGPQGLLFGGFAGSADNRIHVDGPILPQTGDFTVIVDAVIGPFPATRQTLVSQGGVGAGGGWAIKAYQGRMALTYGGIADYSNSTATLTAGRLYRIAVRVQGTVARYYINGIPDSNRTVAATRRAPSRSTCIGAGYFPTTFTDACSVGTQIGNLFIWQRALADSEVKAICENPWQLLRPIQRRMWIAGSFAPPMRLKHWDSGAWIARPLKAWNGGAWTPATLKRHDGAEWH